MGSGFAIKWYMSDRVTLKNFVVDDNEKNENEPKKQISYLTFQEINKNHDLYNHSKNVLIILEVIADRN